MRNIRAAVRFFLFVVATLGLYSVWRVGAFFIPNRQFWRQTAFGAWARSFARIARMRVESVGAPPRSPFFLVCNHLSYTDIAALRCALEGVFVAKSEIEGWPLAGKIVSDMGTIFIDRGNRRDIPRAGAEIIARIGAGEGVVVFPEGTSTKGEEVLPFNSSFLEFAAKTDLPVSYASISYQTQKGEPPASRAVCWWEDVGFAAHLWQLFRVKEFTAVISFGAEPVQNPNRKALARELREKVLEKFVPVV